MHHISFAVAGLRSRTDICSTAALPVSFPELAHRGEATYHDRVNLSLCELALDPQPPRGLPEILIIHRFTGLALSSS